MAHILVMFQIMLLYFIGVISGNQMTFYDWENITGKCDLTADMYTYDSGNVQYELNCTLICEDYIVSMQPWIYTIDPDNTSQSFIFFNDEYDIRYVGAGNYGLTWLSLTNFNSGAAMGEECEEASDCLALNAECASYNESCNTDAQCFVEGEYYACFDTVCKCNGTWYEVKKLNQQKCLAPTKVNQRCVYDEQCYLWDGNSFCNRTCQCHSGYKADVTNTYCAGTVVNITSTDCSPADFANYGKCSLTCQVNAARTDYRIVSHSFIYYSMDSSTNITLFDAVYVDDDKNQNYQAILPLTNYSSGYYQCELHFEDAGDGTVNIQTVNFKISQQQGVSLHSQCSQSSDCTTLNAQCDSSETNEYIKTCNCNGYYGMAYDDDSDSPACLQRVTAGGNCNLADQCTQPNQNYTCSNFVCICSGELTEVAENNNQTMCIVGIDIFQPCMYSEQCSMHTNDSFCKLGECICQNGYQYNDTTNVCFAVIVDYEPGMAAGTVVGIILAIAISIALIIAVILKRRVSMNISLSDGLRIVFNPKNDTEVEYDCVAQCCKKVIKNSTSDIAIIQTNKPTGYVEHPMAATLEMYIDDEGLIRVNNHNYECVCHNIQYLNGLHPKYQIDINNYSKA
ncbi:hypothetical protein CHUAL_007441 [Chamberlinius hualienensis]